ncbi:hypothetical protein Pint_32857 [Pistacia integerrima]|uniref:Uncharacterized protein n=1 Tax=Pistacia integerrima TaxID=434235 RepID=A0ACC0X7V4_9ROSI|nr:hypothetical protein Pint_32857 [Pistacia integerrima]
MASNRDDNDSYETTCLECMHEFRWTFLTKMGSSCRLRQKDEVSSTPTRHDVFSSLTLLFQEILGDPRRLNENVERIWLAKVRIIELGRTLEMTRIMLEGELADHRRIIVDKERQIIKLQLEVVAFKEQAHWDRRTLPPFGSNEIDCGNKWWC